jgi:hypothetical protein
MIKECNLFKALYLYLKLLLRWRSYIWLSAFRKDQREKSKISVDDDAVIDVMFLIVDHFEPARSDGDKAVEKVNQWCEEYEEIAKTHIDSDGVHPQHSWFYRYDLPSFENVAALSKFVYNGFGEIEFHLHHGNDTSESFYHTIKAGVDWFNQTGAMISAEEKPQKKFGYIAGNWALDNGRKIDKFSGVNNEIEILSSLGCYADFTFPAFGTTAQPQKVNTLYYAIDTPEPKSYNTGIDLEAGKSANGDLMIFQGPLFVDWNKSFVDTAAFESFEHYEPQRIDGWERAHIHVKGQPEWIFIKLHTHGMQSKDIFLGEQFKQMCRDLESRYKTSRYRLHYVTAREAFNIAKAAEAGKSGNANDYRDFLIETPVNKKVFSTHAYAIQSYTKQRIHITIPDYESRMEIMFKESPVQSIQGCVGEIEIVYKDQFLKKLKIMGKGTCEIAHRENSNSPALRSIEMSLPFNFSD